MVCPPEFSPALCCVCMCLCVCVDVGSCVAVSVALVCLQACISFFCLVSISLLVCVSFRFSFVSVQFFEFSIHTFIFQTELGASFFCLEL